MYFFRRLQHKIKDFFFERKMAKQRKKKGYADCDCWGLYYWLGATLPKMILRLRDFKHGAPELKFEEVETFPLDWLIPEIEKKQKEYDESDDDEGFDLYSIFDRWYLILTRIAFCLQQSNEEITEIPNEYSEEYDRQIWGNRLDDLDKKSVKDWLNSIFKVKEYDEKGKPKTYELVTNEPDKEIEEKYYQREKEIFQYREKMKDEAFDLIKKYFYALWD